MLYTFPEELVLFYLKALDLNLDENMALIQGIVEECLLKNVITSIAGSIMKRIESNEKNIQPHRENWRLRFEAYSAISRNFLEYMYTRHWNFNGNARGMPEDLDNNYKALFLLPIEGHWNISEALAHAENEQVQNALKNRSINFVKNLDLQARQYIFVYCYEHGINFAYY
jgi:hypothetical protein